MKILHVTSLLSPLRGGGIVYATYQLSKSLMQRGHQVTVYTSDLDLDKEYVNSLQGVKVYPFNSWLNLAVSYPGFQVTPGMVMQCRRELKDFDVVHLHEYRSFQNMVASYYARKYGIPYIVEAHGGTQKLFGGISKWLFDFAFGYHILRNTSKVISETEAGANEYKKLGVNWDKIILLFPLFDVEQFSKLPSPGLFRQKFNIKEKYIILFLGGIHWFKGLDFLVESLFELKQKRNDFILVLVGSDRGYKSNLEEKINKLNLSNKVLFTGFLGGEEKLSALVDANISIQPSVYEEGITYSSLEAIMCDTPIIVTKNGGAEEDVSRMDGGYIVEYGDKAGLANMIQKILDTPADAASKTKKAKEYITKNLSMEKNVEKYEKVYMDCIKEKNREV